LLSSNLDFGFYFKTSEFVWSCSSVQFSKINFLTYSLSSDSLFSISVQKLFVNNFFSLLADIFRIASSDEDYSIIIFR